MNAVVSRPGCGPARFLFLSLSNLPAVLLAFVLLATAGCGGGGSDPGIRDSTFLPAYDYFVRHDADAPGPWRFATVWGDTPCVYSVRFGAAPGLAGRFQTASGVASVASGVVLAVEGCPGVTPFARLDVTVGSELVRTQTGDFSAGAWEVLSDSELVRVTVSPGAAGVSLQRGNDAAVALGWAEFDALFASDSMAPAWQVGAAASYHFMQLSLLQVEMAFSALVDVSDVAFTNTPKALPCNAFSAPPPGVLARGERVLTWLGSADLGFDLLFTDCWDDEPGDRQDYLYRGGLTLSGWRARADYLGSGPLRFTGFGGDDSVRVPGGVTYRDARLSRVVLQATGPAMIDPERSYTVRGGFAVGFAQP
jgi:hypothetical protein